jgi:hypothetical protein
MAKWYAKRHLTTDPGIREIHYLPYGAPEREIRFVEVNELIVNRTEDTLEPIDFGVDTSSATAHRLLILDVTPGQWEKIRKNKISLPSGWSLDGKQSFSRKK